MQVGHVYEQFTQQLNLAVVDGVSIHFEILI
jgi:hypothetical protein